MAKAKPKPAPVPGPQNDLAVRMNQAGAYQPNAHPEYAQPTPLEKVSAGIDSMFAQMGRLMNKPRQRRTK